MPSESLPEGSGRRLHILSPLLAALSAVWRLLVPAILVLFLSRGNNYEALFGIFVVPVIAMSLVRFFTFRYWMGEHELVIREGVLTRNERHVPYTRIQNIDTSQNPIHRLFRVAEVRIETAGGQEPEANMKVLSLDAVEELRGQVFRQKRLAVMEGAAGSEGAGEERAGEKGVGAAVEGAGASLSGLPGTADPAAARSADPLAVPLQQERRHGVLSLGLRDLAVYGFISNRGMALVAAAFGLWWQASYMGLVPGPWSYAQDSWSDVARWSEDLSRDLLSRVMPDYLASPAVMISSWVGLILAALTLLRVFSVAWAVIKFHGFTLTRAGDDLRTSYGLFTRISATVPRNRVQLIQIRRSLLHRWFGRAEVRVETAGAGGSEEDGEGPDVNRQLIAPLVRMDQLPAVLREIQPEIELEGLDWQALAPKGLRRVMRRRFFFALVPLAPAIYGLGWQAIPVWVAVTALLLGTAPPAYRRMNWAVGEQFVAYRSGWWSRRVLAARFSKVQVVELTQSPIDRRYRMAALRVDTAGGSQTGRKIRIPYLLSEHARSLFERLSLATARTEFRW